MEADKDLRNELDKYPSSFDISECIRSLNGQYEKKYLKLRIDQLIKDVNILKTPTERCRTYNAISFLRFKIGKEDSAFEMNEKTLEIDPDNIIGLGNHARFLHSQQKQVDTIKSDCKKLSELYKDPYKMAIAKADIAFSYTIFGSRFGNKARQLFQEVLAECNKLNSGDLTLSNDFEENFCLWSFGCALAYKRSLNVVSIRKADDLDLSKHNYTAVCELCMDIIAREDHSDVCKLYSARAYVLLGELAYDVVKRKDIFPNGLKDALPQKLHMEVESYFQVALSLGKNCVFVLERCGKYFRYVKKIDKSIDLLEKAIAIKPTSLNHHHLALSLKLQLEMKSNPGRRADMVSQDNGEPVRNREKQVLEFSKNDHTKNMPETVGSSLVYRRCIKSPRKCKYINTVGNEETLKLVESYLDKSFDINMNENARYDKGLLKMQIGEIDEALKIFRSLMRDEYGQCSLVTIANAYEQAGLCLDDLLFRSRSDNQDRDEEDMKMYFKRSIEITCNIVAKLPFLENCWTSAPTLLTFLLGESKTKNNLKDLEFLYRKIKDYGRAVPVLKELRELAEDDVENTETVLKIIKTHMEMNHVDDAVLAFDTIKCLPKWEELVDKELYITVHIEGAFDALKRGDKKVAILRFENAFDYGKSLRDCEQEGEDSERKQYDICILCDSADELKGLELGKKFKKIGIRTTVCGEDVPCGKSILQGSTDIMETSKHFIVIDDRMPNQRGSKMELEYNFSVMKTIISGRNHGNVIILVSDNNQHSDLPKTFSGYKKEIFDFENAIFEHDNLIQECDFLKSLLTSLALGSD